MGDILPLWTNVSRTLNAIAEPSMKLHAAFLWLLTFTMMMALAPAQARSIQVIKRFKAWTVYVYEHDGGKACYAATRPVRLRPVSLYRERVRAYVTIFREAQPRPNARKPQRAEEVSILIGHNLDHRRRVNVRIGKEKFALFADGRTAFVKSRTLERALITAMRKGQSMMVEAHSQTGVRIRDAYSLLGVSAALKRLKDVCRK